jgi:hypothetical protein
MTVMILSSGWPTHKVVRVDADHSHVFGEKEVRKLLPCGLYSKYPSVEALPDWLQGKIAVLRMLEPSTLITVAVAGAVAGVGTHYGDNIFWIVVP